MRKLISKNYLLKVIAILVVSLPALAASTAPQTVAKIQSKIIACDSPRPILCQQNTAPVCGIFSATKAQQTFRNACLACKNPEVKGYETGKCKADLKR